MAGQGIDRREILRYIGIASVASTFPGFRQWAFACSHDDDAHAAHAAAPKPEPASPYQPLFLSPEQFRLVDHLTDMIIPADDSPGAKAAGVAEFIDFMLANRVAVTADEDARSVEERLRQGTAAQIQFIGGLNWLDVRCKSEHKHNFMDCTPAQQVALLEELAYKSKFTPTTERGREFFQMLRDYTVVGFYTSKVGLESLGYPGLRVFWQKMQACPHPDDPEHSHLTEPHSPSRTSSLTENRTPITEQRHVHSLTEPQPRNVSSSLTDHGRPITQHQHAILRAALGSRS